MWQTRRLGPRPAGSPEAYFSARYGAPGCPELRPASANQPCGPRWPGRPHRPWSPQAPARAARGRRRCGRATGCTRRCLGSSSRRPRRCCRARSFGPLAGRSKRRPAAAATKGHWAQSASLAAPPQVLRRPLDAEKSDQRGPRPLPPWAWLWQCRLRRAVAQAQAAHRPTQAAPVVTVAAELRHVAPDAKPPRALVPSQPWCQ